jgi:hypothetical protein
MNLPYLAGVVTANDVRQKGSGSYAADFVSWAKIMQLINKEAPGWMPQLAIAPDGGHVFQAPDGTGFVQISFVHHEEGETMEWPQAVMNNRNQPVAFDKISARDVTDTHRRAICSAAAAFFSLGYELWAREEYAAAEAESVKTAEVAKPEIQQQQPAVKSKPAPKESLVSMAEDPKRLPLEAELVDLVQKNLSKEEAQKFINEKAALWELNKGGSRIAQMNSERLQICIDELKSRKPTKKAG